MFLPGFMMATPEQPLVRPSADTNDPPDSLSHEDPGEPALIERAKQDPRAFTTLYKRYYKMVASCIYRRTADVHLTEDLAAETFIAAFGSLPKYRVTTVPFRFWLLRIASNAVNRWVRKHGSIRDSGAAPASTDLPANRDPVEHGIATEELLAALGKLPARHQTVLSLHYLESLPLDDVAAVLGCRVGTVKSRLSRARDALREELKQRGAK